MAETVKEITECFICSDLFSDPRMLPCIHAFCLKCLNKVSVESKLKPRNLMPCPVCRNAFVIPLEGIAGLRKDFFLERLAEISKISNREDEPAICETCAEDREKNETETPAAVQYCIQCRKNICNSCYREHRKYQDLKKHQLISLEGPMEKDLANVYAVQHCEQHRDKLVELYCGDCEIVICTICFIENHKPMSHDCVDIKKAADQFCDNFQSDVKQLKKASFNALKDIQNLREVQSKFRKQVEEAKNAIIKRGSEMKEFIDKGTEKLINELDLIEKRKSKQLETEMEERERQKNVLESLELYISELTSKGSSVEICRSVKYVHNRPASLQRGLSRQRESITVQFSPNQSFLEKVRVSENIVGVIEVQSEVTIEGESMPNSPAFYDNRQTKLQC